MDLCDGVGITVCSLVVDYCFYLLTFPRDKR